MTGITAACSSTPSAAGTPPATADTRTPEQVIRATTLADPASIDALDGIRFKQDGVSAAAAILAGRPTGDLLWAATWVYASGGTDPAPLRPLLADADPTIRLMAASALVAMGDRSGFAIISASLTQPDPLVGSDPQISIGAFAATRLAQYVVASDAPPIPEADADGATFEASWADWLGRHESTLRFDAGNRTWTAP